MALDGMPKGQSAGLGGMSDRKPHPLGLMSDGKPHMFGLVPHVMGGGTKTMADMAGITVQVRRRRWTGHGERTENDTDECQSA